MIKQAISIMAQGLSPSATFAMSQRSNELKEQGIDIINLSVGEPDFNTPDNVKLAAFHAIEENYSKYSPVTGFESLKESICDKLYRENNLSYVSSEIVVSNGAKQSIFNSIQALVNPGDEVIIPAPFWVSYPQMVKLVGGSPVYIEASMERRFKITASQLERAITKKTKLLILCSPCNPTGAVYSAIELMEIAEVVLKHKNMYVISDEIYEHINYVGGHSSIACIPGMKERTVLINGVSKAYAMTGWRIGFMAAPQWIASACNLIQGQTTSGPCSVSQKAAEEAWRGNQESVEIMRQAFEKRRDLIVHLMGEIPGLEINEPEGAFYLFPKCSSYIGKSCGNHKIASSSDLAMFLLEVGHVATVGGDAFGAPGYLRLSFATSIENIRTGVERIKSALQLLS